MDDERVIWSLHGSLVYNLCIVEYSRTLMICKEPTKVLENS